LASAPPDIGFVSLPDVGPLAFFEEGTNMYDSYRSRPPPNRITVESLREGTEHRELSRVQLGPYKAALFVETDRGALAMVACQTQDGEITAVMGCTVFGTSALPHLRSAINKALDQMGVSR
jgi:hypothetical protein